MSRFSGGTKVTFPLVIKYSGLADGKGVFVCKDKAEALVAIERIAKAPKVRIGNCWKMLDPASVNKA